MEEKIKAILSEILDIEESDIHPEFGPDDADSWDSLQNLRIITALEREFDVKIAMSDIEKMVNFTEIRDVLQSYVSSSR